ncbi:hypothetical protein ANCDUO_14283 [Ancylostoma duodenale]|uniref:Uncharacterized protein n=1 Tax=Ancylostoma duodenale TaxID=51022 RepID=A0A0C2G3N2_9BILA|nr:hypothetical protein ANCDUO_14283 [Ancylostoma duodenale]
MPSFDYSAVDCMHELLFNKTHLGQLNKLQLPLYENLSNVAYNVRYHKNRANPDPDFKLDCGYHSLKF